MDRQNEKCICARNIGRRKNNAGNDKDEEEEKKLAGSLAKKELPAKGCSRRNGKLEDSSCQKISDNRQHYDKWTVWRYEKEGRKDGRVENAEFAVKYLPLGTMIDDIKQ